MVAFFGFVIFAASLVMAIGVIVSTVAPHWARISRMAIGHVEPAFQPLSMLAGAERRIAVRSRAARWTSLGRSSMEGRAAA